MKVSKSLKSYIYDNIRVFLFDVKEALKNFQYTIKYQLRNVVSFGGEKKTEAGLVYTEFTVRPIGKKTEKSLTWKLERFDDTSICSLQQFGTQILTQYEPYFNPVKNIKRTIAVPDEEKEEEEEETCEEIPPSKKKQSVSSQIERKVSFITDKQEASTITVAAMERKENVYPRNSNNSSLSSSVPPTTSTTVNSTVVAPNTPVHAAPTTAISTNYQSIDIRELFAGNNKKKRKRDVVDETTDQQEAQQPTGTL